MTDNDQFKNMPAKTAPAQTKAAQALADLDQKIDKLMVTIEELLIQVAQLSEIDVGLAKTDSEIIDVLTNHENILKKVAPWATVSKNPNSLKNRRNGGEGETH